MNKVPMTVLGVERLREELQRLKTVDRQAVIKAIAEARAHGDLKENAEYHAAREQQSFIEGRILEIEGKLSRAQVIDITALPYTGRVVFGCTVKLINADTEEEVSFKIVGEDEADIREGKISVGSPIARALIAKQEGDVAEVRTPDGIVAYEIVEVVHV